MSRKVINIILSVLFHVVFASLLFAGGANEGNLYYYPRTVVNNQNVMIELSSAHKLTASSIDTEFKNTSTDNLAFFRIRDSLRNVSENENVKMTISSTSNWKFVHETNSTSTRDFKLSVFCVEMTENDRVYSAATPVEIVLDSTTQLPSKKASVSFSKNGGSYQISFPTTTFNRRGLGGFSLYAAYIRDFDFCIVLDPVEDGVYLETGYYTTTMDFTVSSYKKSDDTSSWGYHNLVERDGDLITFSVTLRGYVGITPEMSSEPSFIVTSTSLTYSMDLAPVAPKVIPDSGYKIANIKFTQSNLSSTNPDNVGSNKKGDKYKIYISPTNEYTDSGKYYFIKNGTENSARTSDITVYYDLYIDGTKITSGPNNSTPYCLKPAFTSPQVSSSGLAGGSNLWKYTWTLDKDIYLKVLDSNPDHYSSGFYYSYIYFTLVTEE